MNQVYDGFLRKLYPLTKINYVFIFALISLFLPHFSFLFILFGIILVLAAVGSNLGAFIKAVSQSLALIIFLVFLLQGLFRPGTHVLFEFWIFSFKQEGLLYAANLSGILLVVAGSFILFFQTTEVEDFILALEKAKVSPQVSYVVLSTMQMIPQTKKRSELIMNAQQARGIETKGNLRVRIRAFVPMIAPLILSSFSGIEERALTLEARAFSAPCKKTNIRELHKNPIDTVLVYAGWILFVLIVIARITLWR